MLALSMQFWFDSIACIWIVNSLWHQNTATLQKVWLRLVWTSFFCWSRNVWKRIQKYTLLTESNVEFSRYQCCSCVTLACFSQHTLERVLQITHEHAQGAELLPETQLLLRSTKSLQMLSIMEMSHRKTTNKNFVCPKVQKELMVPSPILTITSEVVALPSHLPCSAGGCFPWHRHAAASWLHLSFLM